MPETHVLRSGMQGGRREQRPGGARRRSAADLFGRLLSPRQGVGGRSLAGEHLGDDRHRRLDRLGAAQARLGAGHRLGDRESADVDAVARPGLDPGGAQVASLAAGKDSAQGRVRLSGQTWLYSVYPGESLSNLRYGLLVLENAYYRSLEPLLIQLAALILVIVAGVILAVFLSRRTWSPFRQILPIVRRSAAGRDSEYHSLAEFSQALTDFAKEKELLLKQVLASEQR